MLVCVKFWVFEVNCGEVWIICGDFWEVELLNESYDVVLVGVVFYYLRDDVDWLYVFEKLFCIVVFVGGLWIMDMVLYEIEVV